MQLSGGPWDGLTITTTVPVIMVLGDGYDTWHYTADPQDPTAPWPGVLHRPPIGHAE